MTKDEYDKHVAGKHIPWTPSHLLNLPVMTVPMSTSSEANGKQIGGNHYNRLKIQVWDFVIANDLDYFQGSITKYVTRWKDKDGIKDLYKARHFLDKYIETMEEKFKDMTERPDGQEADKKA